MKTITSITVSDVEKRRLPSKHYVYVIFVRWSDGGQYVIYRRYSRFFDLQSTLLDKFPIEAGTIDPTQRILPILPGKIIFGRSHVREVAVKRLKPIEAYCKALIKLPASISHCEDILDFFEVDDDDLEPPSDELRKIAELKAEEISKPKELKRLVAVEDYRQQDRGEIDLRAGQVVELVEQSHSGWWFVNAEDEQGWVPSTFLQSLESEMDEDTFNTVSKNKGDRYMCVADYPAGHEDELSLHKGDVLQVLETNMHGWWPVIYQGVHGLAPATYLTKLHDQQTLSLAEKGRVSGVEIISSLSEISELLNQTTPTAKSHRVGAEATMQNSKVEVGSEKLTSRIEVGAQKVNKTKSLERGGSLRPPPRQQSIEKAAVEIGTQKAANGYSTRAEFCDPVGDGISFKANQAVKVLERAAGGWWFVQIGDQEGWAPASYIKPTPQVEENINHQQKSSATTLDIASIKPLSERKPTVPMPPERKHIILNHPKENSSETPKQFSLTDVNNSCDNFDENGTSNKRSGGRVGEVGNHVPPPVLDRGVTVTSHGRVTAQQITAHSPRFQTKPKPPLKPILSKPKDVRDPHNLSMKSKLKENMEIPGEPIMHGITASLKAKFEQSDSSRKLLLTCPTSKHGTSTSKFTQSKKMATKPKLPSKPIGKIIEKNKLNTLTKNEESPQGFCEKVNVNAVVSSLSGQLSICDQQTCIAAQARTQQDELQVSPRGAARTQRDGLQDHPGVATTRLDGLQVSPRGDARTLDQLRSQVKANKSSRDHGCSESIYTSLCGFTAEQDGEVSFVEGESMTVLERLDGGWWLVRLSNGREGWVPSAFLSKG